MKNVSIWEKILEENIEILEDSIDEALEHHKQHPDTYTPHSIKFITSLKSHIEDYKLSK